MLIFTRHWRQSSRVGCRGVRAGYQKSAASRQCSFVQQFSTSHWCVQLCVCVPSSTNWSGEKRRVLCLNSAKTITR